MTEETKLQVRKAFKIVILLAGFIGIADNELTAAFSAIQMSYPTVSDSAYSLFMSGSMLTLLLGALLTPVLSRKISPKKLLVFSYALFAVCATFGAAFSSFTYMIVMRLLVGFAMGIGGTVTFTLIADVYTDEKERSSVMGLSSTVGGILGMILGIVGGTLAALPDWHPVFYPYAFAFIILILIIIFVPDIPAEGDIAYEGEEEGKPKYPWKKLLPLFLAFLIYGILYFISLYYVSFYLVETGMDDASAAVAAGIFTSVGSAAGIISGIAFGPFYMKVKRWTPAICLLLTALAFFTYAFTTNEIFIMVMAFVASFAYILLNTYYFTYGSMLVSPSQMSLTMAILTICMNVGGFFSTFIMEGIMGVTMTVSGGYLVVAVLLMVGCIISVILAARAHKRGDDIPDMEMPEGEEPPAPLE